MDTPRSLEANPCRNPFANIRFLASWSHAIDSNAAPFIRPVSTRQRVRLGLR